MIYDIKNWMVTKTKHDKNIFKKFFYALFSVRMKDLLPLKIVEVFSNS